MLISLLFIFFSNTISKHGYFYTAIHSRFQVRLKKVKFDICIVELQELKFYHFLGGSISRFEQSNYWGTYILYLTMQTT